MMASNPCAFSATIKFTLAMLLAVHVVMVGKPGIAQPVKTKEVALQESFASCDTVTRHVLFLEDAQIAEIEKRAKVKLDSKIMTYYRGLKKEKIFAYAFVESNIVRTKPETFMVLLNPDATVMKVEMLTFLEPADYLPAKSWFKLYENRSLNDQLWPKRSIHNVTGATLTVRAITQGVRKVLAIFEVAIDNPEKSK